MALFLVFRDISKKLFPGLRLSLQSEHFYETTLQPRKPPAVPGQWERRPSLKERQTSLGAKATRLTATFFGGRPS